MKYLSLFLLIAVASNSFAQEFRGGELWFDHTVSNEYDIYVDVYLKDAPTDVKPYLLVNIVGNLINLDTAYLILNESLTQNTNLLRYKTNFAFDQENTYYPIYVADTFYLPSLKNLEGENKSFFFLSGILTSVSVQFFGLNDPPLFSNPQTEYWFDEGVFYFDSKADDPDNDTLFYFLKDYDYPPFYEYSKPDASDTITCGFTDGLLKWNKPTEPGKYLIGVDVLEYHPSGYFLSRRTRDMIIEITEDDIISSQSAEVKDNKDFQLYPNPASAYSEINLPENTRNASLTLFTASGQYVRTQYQFSDRIIVPLDGIAPGLYFYEVKDEGRALGNGKLVKVE
jgi:hypothetical protein